jgi:arylsulfatase A-like enzyme
MRIVVCFCALISMFVFADVAQAKPNIVVIVTDDQGYADISFNPLHPKAVATPHMDALAKAGVFFSQAYTSGNVCSPTRAGLMTGRYQQRVGIYTAGEGGSGLPLKEKTFPQFLKPAGYVSGIFGKWHLGLTPPYNPIARGFDEFYGFMGRGAHDYFNLAGQSDAKPMYRGLKEIKDKGYLTTRLTDEACSFIGQHKQKPFFLYLAYNAVHAPAQAPAEDIKQFNTGDKKRDVLMAMLKHLDAGVGRVVSTLKKEGVWNNTLLIFLTDNGGSKAMNANNTPLRGFKGQNYEGGIRTPFIVCWPDKIKGGRTINTPVISLDILPTALDAAGVSLPKTKPFDGKSLLPVIAGKTASLHKNLFWSESGFKGTWAVRSDNWKLVAIRNSRELFDLKSDPREKNNVAGKHADKVNELTKLYNTWLDQMAEPNNGASKRWKKGTLSPREKKKAARRKKRKMMKNKKSPQNKRHVNHPGK